jgi:hypothetical protein
LFLLSGFEVLIRSDLSAESASKLLCALLDTAMQVRSSSCPSVKLRCLVLSAMDIRAGLAEPLGWPAQDAWSKDNVPRKVWSSRVCRFIFPFLSFPWFSLVCFIRQGRCSEKSARLLLMNPVLHKQLRDQGAVLSEYGLIDTKRYSCRYEVFISFRMEEAGDMPEKLQEALDAKDVSSFVSTIDSTSDNIADDIAKALCGCKLFVVLGTKTFGKKTDIGFSTFNELQLACDIKKPIFLIKMFDGDFTEPTTRMQLPKAMPFVVWRPCTVLPMGIVDAICAMVHDMA